MRKLLREAEVDEIYHALSIETFKGDEDALKEVQKYISNLEKMKEKGFGIVAWGKKNGLGKTMLMVEVLKAAAKKMNPKTRNNHSIYMTSLSKIVSMVTGGWNSPMEREKFNKKIIQRDFILIDDVDKTFMPKGENNLVTTSLDMVMRSRVHNCKPTLITTNVTPKELTTIFGESIGSLLAGHNIPIEFSGIDFRRIHPAVEVWKSLDD
jgi:DNA replication protein DnaC